MKPQAKTLQERMGFVDHDLKTPGHDAIMMWLNDTMKVNRLLRFCLKVKGWSDDDLASGLDLPGRREIQVISTTWERPVTTGREFTVGFLDLAVSYQEQRVWYSVHAVSGQRIYHLDWKSAEAFFEVKTSIASLGELLRQLQFYRQHVQGPIFVVSPDTRYRNKIEEQGFGFIHCPEPSLNSSGEWICCDPL